MYDTRTVKQYLLDKRRMLKKDRASFFESKITNSFSKSSKSILTHQYILKNKMRLTKEIVLATGKDSWTITKSINDLKDECKRQNYTLKYNQRGSFNLVKNLLVKNIDEYVQKGHTRIYM